MILKNKNVNKNLQKSQPKMILTPFWIFSNTNNVTEQHGDQKHVYTVSVGEEYSFHLLSPPITIPREPKLAKPQRA